MRHKKGSSPSSSSSSSLCLVMLCSVGVLFLVYMWTSGHISSHTVGYKKGDEVSVSMNKVWPHYNPVETYSVYDALPVCKPPEVLRHSMSFGQIMRGDRLVNSLYKIRFAEKQDISPLCTRPLTKDDVETFHRAIDGSYLYEVYVADLPVHQLVGLKDVESDPPHYYIANHINFDLGYNHDQVVHANTTAGTDLFDVTQWTEGMTIPYTYSVDWKSMPDVPREARLYSQLKGALTASTSTLDIHWLAIINSFVLVLLIVSLLILIILRVVRSDLSKFLKIPDEELSAGGRTATSPFEL
eukprot:GHVQ01015016.1.p1 GENE.GHVQ01015016.1~~GHVQ01015016.1.p1  ORF type:complete len:298 (+),score=29.51 GHVQ01015016.1:517-1410(+)